MTLRRHNWKVRRQDVRQILKAGKPEQLITTSTPRERCQHCGAWRLRFIHPVTDAVLLTLYETSGDGLWSEHYVPCVEREQ